MIDLFDNTQNIKNTNPQTNGWVQTYSGRKFFPLSPTYGSIVIQDIARSISRICRFNGHVTNCDFYSVAQHSVLVSYLCDYKDSLHGLLHDGAEFVFTDLPMPLKYLPEFEFYRKAEKHLQALIFKRFGISTEEPASVKLADKIMLSTEAHNFMSPIHSDWKLEHEPLPIKIIPLMPKEAEQLFMKRFEELFKEQTSDTAKS